MTLLSVLTPKRYLCICHPVFQTQLLSEPLPTSPLSTPSPLPPSPFPSLSESLHHLLPRLPLHLESTAFFAGLPSVLDTSLDCRQLLFLGIFNLGLYGETLVQNHCQSRRVCQAAVDLCLELTRVSDALLCGFSSFGGRGEKYLLSEY